jgi:hypothetical protein
MEFLDRHDAGRRLAAQLAPLAREDPIVIALPRGGVPPGCERCAGPQRVGAAAGLTRAIMKDPR